MDQIGENLGSPAVVIAAVVPALLLMWFFHSRDVFHEPARVLWTTFALGVGCIALLLPITVPVWWLDRLVDNPVAAAACAAFLAAALPEELCKFVVLYRYSARQDEFNEPMDGIVYGVAASLGFATFENLFYAAHGGMAVAVVRAVTAIPAHATFGAIMGYYMGQAFLASADRRSMLVRSLGWAILLHGLYDFPIMVAARLNRDRFAGEMPAIYFLLLHLVTLLVLLAGLTWAVVLVRRLRAQQRRRVREGGGDSALVQKPRGGTRGWVLLLAGGLITIAGAILTVVLAVVMSDGVQPIPTTLQALLVSAPVGVLGLTLFGLGIRALNQIDRSAA